MTDSTAEYGLLPVTTAASGLYDAAGSVIAYSEPATFTLLDSFDLTANYTNTAAVEKFFKKVFGTTEAFEKLWPTMSSLHKVGDNLYLLDYQFDYDIEDLMQKGASSAVDLLGYTSKYILGNTFSFRLGSFDFGCSAFETYNEKDDHFMGRNFDYMDAPSYVVWTHPENGYASVSMVDGTFLLTTDRLLTPESTLGRFQTLLAPYLPLDGINEKGLSVCVLQIHDNATRQNNGKTDMFTTAMIRIVLDKAKNVEEAIRLFDSFDLSDTVLGNLSLGASFHYLVSDASGDAAIIEYVNGEMRVIREEDSKPLCVTNFYVSEDGGVGSDSYDPEGMERFDMMKTALTEGQNMLTFDQTFKLLSDVHLNYRHDNGLYDITTLWSGLYNNTQKTLSIAPRMNYGEIYTFDVLRPMRVIGTASGEVTTPREGIGLR